MNELRRIFLKAGVSTAVLSPLLAGSLLSPITVLAAEWNRNAFSARTVSEALKVMGATTATESRDIAIGAPEIAENGAKVEIEITSNLPDVRSLALFADKNPMPLCAALELSGQMLPFARCQLKLSESTRLRAVARTGDGKFHVAFREVKVTLGGC